MFRVFLILSQVYQTSALTVTDGDGLGAHNVPSATISELKAVVGDDNVLTHLTGAKAQPNPFMPTFWNHNTNTTLAVDPVVPGASVYPQHKHQVVDILNICTKFHEAHPNKEMKCVLRSYEGHSYVGQSTVNSTSTEPGIVIHLRDMKSVSLVENSCTDNNDDSDFCHVDAGAGISLIALYTQLAANWKNLGAKWAMGFSGGSCPSVGLSGLLSGGGMGLESAAHGWTADNLVWAEVAVNQDGAGWKLVEATATNEYADLFKALRGGMGGNYGAVINWRVKAFRAPRVVNWLINAGTADEAVKHWQQAEAVQTSKKYMKWTHENPNMWAQVNVYNADNPPKYQTAPRAITNVKFLGQCLCEIKDGVDDCKKCHEPILNMTKTADPFAAIKCDYKDVPEQYQDKDAKAGGTAFNTCNIIEQTLGEANWWAGYPCDGTAVKFPGLGHEWPVYEKAIEDCLAASVAGSELSPYTHFQAHHSSFFDTSIHDDDQFLYHLIEKVGSDPHSGGFEIDSIGGAMLTEPTDCHKDGATGACTSVNHRTQGWHSQYNSYWDTTEAVYADSHKYRDWINEARTEVQGKWSLKTAYQNYLTWNMTVDHEDETFNWKKQYFPLDKTYEHLQQVKAKYNPGNTFGKAATKQFEIELP